MKKLYTMQKVLQFYLYGQLHGSFMKLSAW